MSSFFRLSVRDSYDFAGLFCWLWHKGLGEKIQDYSKRRCSGIPYFFRYKRTGRHYFFCTSEIFWLIRFYLSATARNLLPSSKFLWKHLEINIASQTISTIIISNSWQKYCKFLWVNEFYKIIARVIFSGRLERRQKKWRLESLTPPSILKCFLRLKLQNFAVKLNCKNRFTFHQKNQNMPS